MTDPLLYNGRLHSPFSLFIRKPHGFSDAELLIHFGLDNYQRTSNPTAFPCHAILADADGWILLADDWYYTLWHMKSTQTAIQNLSIDHDIFACSEGDCDRSFDYVYYNKGKLLRELIVHSPNYSDRIVYKEHGDFLLGEAELLLNDGYNIGIELAANLGMKTYFTMDELRVYVPTSKGLE